jgi:hypothetical protein
MNLLIKEPKMGEDSVVHEEGKKNVKIVHHSGGGSNPVYTLGMIGAWMFYFKGAATPEEKAKAFFKGLVWPVFLVNELFLFLKK